MMATSNTDSGYSGDGGENSRGPGFRAQQGRTSSQQEKKARARILAEWLGAYKRPDPSRNIHQPGEYLEGLLESIGLSEGVDEQRLKEVWTAVAGDFVASHTVPESIRKGVLVLRVLQPTMKFHLQQMSGKLLENLHRELGKETISKVVFKIG